MTRAREFAHCSTTRTAEAMAKHTETSANLKIELDATMVVWDWLTKENAMVRWFFWNHTWLFYTSFQRCNSVVCWLGKLSLYGNILYYYYENIVSIYICEKLVHYTFTVCTKKYDKTEWVLISRSCTSWALNILKPTLKLYCSHELVKLLPFLRKHCILKDIQCVQQK